MKKNNKTPKLRFSGYTDDWEQRKLQRVANADYELCTALLTGQGDIHPI